MAAVFGVVIATGIMMGQSIGAKDLPKAKQVVATSAVFIVLLSLATAVVGAFAAGPILRLMSTPPVTLALVIFGSLWLARIPFAYGLAPRWGEDAIWWSFPEGSIVGVLLGGLYSRFGDWRKVQIMRGVGRASA